MKRATEIKVGVMVLLGIAMLLAGIFWLGQWASRAGTVKWMVRFDQAGGLQDGAEVQVNGIRSGLVQGIKLDGNDVVVGMALDEDITLTSSDRVSIRNVGLMGDKVLFVTYTGVGAQLSRTDTLTGIFEKGMGEVMAEMGNATGGFQSISVQLDSIAAAMNRNGGIGRTVDDMQRTASELRSMVEENRASLNTTLRNFAQTSTVSKNLLTSREAQLKEAMDDFAKAADNFERLSGRLDSLRASMQSVASKVDEGDGTLGKLVNDRKLYADLSASVQDIKRLIEDVKANPRKYFKFSVF
jgi:phospholipid/cholesterol/gamma-HCH transport system substrate-binding protein